MRHQPGPARPSRERSRRGIPSSVTEFIDRHYAEPLTVAALARRARLSRFHFIRAFRAATGMTPYQYVRERRLARARHLLSTTTMPVTDVCHAAGFSSLGSFSSLFRRATGQSPVRYRASERRPVYIPGCFVRMYRLGR